ncbi:hypothetical protein KF282_1961 [Lactococcus lactis subsp. lactis]|uniref:Uncharacterized protein n=1 Tax=Lactococcus lactis subsp. lactis TaxID=1360 RepID=A0A0V8CNU6_LACLL|nr:hypothetical protein KF282_1961 [Lactococcus lactis subsp. lactis]
MIILSVNITDKKYKITDRICQNKFLKKEIKKCQVKQYLINFGISM